MVYDKEGFYRTAMEVAQSAGDQSGKTFLITGAYSGIGVETTKALLAQNAQVILAGRNAEAMKTFVSELTVKQPEEGEEESEENNNNALIDADGPLCDLNDLRSVLGFAKYVLQKYTKLDVLILNAGVMMTPPGVTAQKLERQIGINCVGHFLLAQKLLPITSRQVWLSSSAHSAAGAKRFEFSWFQNFDVEDEYEVSCYDPMFAYQQSKLGTILLAKEFAKRCSGEGEDKEAKVEAVSLHPGVINTNLGRHLPGYLKLTFSAMSWVGLMSRKTVEQGAATTVTCATLSSEELKNGAYYDDCQVGKESGNATNTEDAIRLYDLCLQLTQDVEEEIEEKDV